MDITDPTSSRINLQNLCLKHDLFLKPVCKVNITVQISGLNSSGLQNKAISTWEVADKLRQLCPSLLSPPNQLKIVKATVEFVRFVVELDSKNELRKVITAVDSQRIKLSGFPQALRVRAVEAPLDCPRRHDWDAFFRDAQDMNETKPGERPDTLVLKNLPIRWFASEVDRSGISGSNSVARSNRPSMHLIMEVFEVFGPIRRIDVPMLDICQNPQLLATNGISTDTLKANLGDISSANPTEEEHTGFGKITPSMMKISSYPENDICDSTLKSDSHLLELGAKEFFAVGNSLTFTAFVQYIDYSGFASAMEALRGMKLVYAPKNRQELVSNQGQQYFSADIQVDFDRSKHLSEASIKQRDVMRKRLEDLVERRRAASTAAEFRKRRLTQEAEERAASKLREANALAEAQRQADAAERQASELARKQRQRLKSAERYRRKKDSLIQQKLIFEGRRTLVAERRAAAIRLISALLHLASQREEESAKECDAKLRKSTFSTVDMACQFQLSSIRSSSPIVSSVTSTDKYKGSQHELRHSHVSLNTKFVINIPKTKPASTKSSEKSVSSRSPDSLRQLLLERRESQLRERLLQRCLSAGIRKENAPHC